MRFKENIMDEIQVRRTLIRMSHEIIERNRGVENLVFVGIKRRGLELANEMSKIIKTVEDKDVPVGAIDIVFYREDFSTVASHPQTKGMELPFDIDNANIILVDDVLYTGRTIQAAIETLSLAGRPKTIKLAVLIERTGRELPIGAEYIGKMVNASLDELVTVSVRGVDNESRADVYSLKD